MLQNQSSAHDDKCQSPTESVGPFRQNKPLGFFGLKRSGYISKQQLGRMNNIVIEQSKVITELHFENIRSPTPFSSQ